MKDYLTKLRMLSRDARLLLVNLTLFGYRGMFLAGAAIALAGILMLWECFIAPRGGVADGAVQALRKDATIWHT